MSNSIDEPRMFIRGQLYESINNIVESYFMTASSKAKFPYATIDLKEIDDEALTQYSLDIEVYDKHEDTSKLEKICDKLKNELDGKRVISENFAYKIWFNDCLTNFDEDKTIKRRIVSFTIHLFKFI